MAMEAAETAYLAQLAADAKLDAALGYVEPWSMPRSVDQFAGKEGDDDGGLDEWEDDRYHLEQGADSNSAGAPHSGYDDVIFAEPVGGYESPLVGQNSQEENDYNNFYGNDYVESQPSDFLPHQRAHNNGRSRVEPSSDRYKTSQVPSSQRGRVEVETSLYAAIGINIRCLSHQQELLIHVFDRGKPSIILSIEGSIEMPALVFETRGWVRATCQPQTFLSLHIHITRACDFIGSTLRQAV
jgi:hypothetical protein